MEKSILQSIGSLEPHPDVPDEWLVSEPIAIPFFDGKQLEIILDGYLGDENFITDADKAISNFLAKDKTDRLEISSLIFKFYKDIFEVFDDDGNIPRIENEKEIWQFVYPQEIYVTRRSRRDKDIYIQIHCECIWEEEHGLQIVFRQGKKVTRVSSIDGHETEADADDIPDADDELLSKF